MPSVDDLLKWLHPVDFAVLGHGWAKHGRDYGVQVQDMLGADPGTHELSFTHCVRLDYRRVSGTTSGRDRGATSSSTTKRG